MSRLMAYRMGAIALSRRIPSTQHGTTQPSQHPSVLLVLAFPMLLYCLADIGSRQSCKDQCLDRTRE